MSELDGSAGEDRLQRVVERGAERDRRRRGEGEIAVLRAQLAKSEARRERAATTRFVAMCVLVLLGLAAVVYLQIDSRGSGRLRSELSAQCQVRNANIDALRGALEQLADTEPQPQPAAALREAARQLNTPDCGEYLVID